MPYKGMELPSVYPSSSFPDGLLLTDERKTGLQSAETMGHCYASKVDSGAASCHELGATPNFSVESPSYFTSGDKLDSMGAHCENGLFSSSLSGMFSRKLRLYPNNPSYDQSAAASLYKEDEPFESLEELEAQTIGNLLPDDDDLLSGVTDGVEYSQPHNGDYTDDLDVFSSVGGMELGDDGLTFGQSNSNICDGNPIRNLVGLDGSELPLREHLSGEHPSRTLFVRNINSCIEDSELHSLFGKFGDIRTLYTACKNRGFVMISYYDIRAAWNAMKALQNKPLKERKLDIHFSIPKDNPSKEDVNHGTLLIFNQDSSVSDGELFKFFGVYGEIKEIHETPLTSHHKIIEFYDVRAAEAALRAMKQSDTAGKRITVESSWPGGARRFGQPFSSESDQDGSGFPMQPTCSSSSISSGLAGLYSHGGTASCMNNDKICGLHRTTGCSHSGVFKNSFDHLMSSSVPNSLPSLIRTGSAGHQSGLVQSCGPKGEMKFDLQTLPGFHPPHSLSDFCDRLGTRNSCSSPNHMSPSSLAAVPSEINETQQFIRMNSNGTAVQPNEGAFSPSGNGSCPPAGHYYMWNNMKHPRSPGIIWPNSPSIVNGFCAPCPQPMPTVPRAPNDMLTPSLPMRKHHVGSAPSVNSSLWERRNAYSGESPDASVFHPGSVGDIRISGNTPHPLEFVPRNVFPGGRESYMDLTVRSKNVRFGLHPQRCMMFPARGQLIPLMNDFGSPNERTRNRRNESAPNQVDNKKQFELDIDRILRGDDKRTTLMIKNIPNKYTSKMLLAVIDEQHRGTYDFIYLPIDFKNKCNMGYAFINMISPSLIVPFYQDFNGKRWEKFNSEKVAILAYARIQGKDSLIAHFQNSSLMNEDKRCRPILFNTDGPNAGDQVPFPVGVSVRPRMGKSRARTGEDNREESPQILLKDEVASN